MSDIFSDENLKDAESCPSLGPAYFCSQEIVERFMTSFEAEYFKPMIEAFAKQFTDKLWDGIPDYLASDTESNLQGLMYRQVDDCVKALLGGSKWALVRYALGPRYDCEEIRAAVAAHIPAELQEKRIADLEDEIAILRSTVEMYRR